MRKVKHLESKIFILENFSFQTKSYHHDYQQFIILFWTT